MPLKCMRLQDRDMCGTLTSAGLLFGTEESNHDLQSNFDHYNGIILCLILFLMYYIIAPLHHWIAQLNPHVKFGRCRVPG